MAGGDPAADAVARDNLVVILSVKSGRFRLGKKVKSALATYLSQTLMSRRIPITNFASFSIITSAATSASHDDSGMNFSLRAAHATDAFRAYEISDCNHAAWWWWISSSSIALFPRWSSHW